MNDDLNRAIRATFVGTARGMMRIENAVLTQETNGFVLHFTGFHSDDTPFAVLTAPFTGSPIERAAQLAQDMIATHTGKPFMPAPVAIRGLAATFREALKSATDRAIKQAEEAKTEVANLHSVLDQGDEVVRDVKAATAEVQSALGLNTNGGPPLA